MLTEQQFEANDADDRQRLYWVMSGLAAAALGVDPGPSPYDQGALGSRPGQNQVFSVTTGTAPQGQAAVTANIAGYQVTLPILLLIGAGAWLLLRR